MIVNNFAKAKISCANVNYYKKLGYTCKPGDTLEVPVEQLSSGSKALVLVQCNYCSNQFWMMYIAHNERAACSQKCINEKKKETSLKNFGVEWGMQTKEIQNKSKATCKEKYGDENYNNREAAKNTCLKKYNCENPAQDESIKKKMHNTSVMRYGIDYRKQQEEKSKITKKERYGDEHYHNFEQTKITCLKKYNSEYSVCSDICKEKSKITMLRNYGVETPGKSSILIARGQETRRLNYINNKYHIKTKYYKNTNLFYQSNNELDFLNIYYDKIQKLQRGPCIKFEFENSLHNYFSDFFIPSLNLIIEIKSTYMFELHKEKNLAKQKECLKQGFNFMFITDCNYSEFENYLKSNS